MSPSLGFALTLKYLAAIALRTFQTSKSLERSGKYWIKMLAEQVSPCPLCSFRSAFVKHPSGLLQTVQHPFGTENVSLYCPQGLAACLLLLLAVSQAALLTWAPFWLALNFFCCPCHLNWCTSSFLYSVCSGVFQSRGFQQAAGRAGCCLFCCSAFWKKHNVQRGTDRRNTELSQLSAVSGFFFYKLSYNRELMRFVSERLLLESSDPHSIIRWRA